MKTGQMLFPPAANRAEWKHALKQPWNRGYRKYILQEAKRIQSEDIPPLPAHLYMEFVRNGNRTHYEQPYFLRRQNLNTLILAEAIEYRGRFLDRIIDYIWEITAEHTWCVPAHVPRGNDPLPFLEHECIDLFAAETGMLLSQALNLLEPELKEVSPNLVKMLRQTLLERIIEPLETQTFWWQEGRNNWTPWVSSNCLGVILTVLADDPARRKKMIELLSKSVDQYIRKYSEDGGCDEGPTYWQVSPAVMLFFFEQLQTWPDNPKIKKMGEYITDAYLGDGYLAAFADAKTNSDFIHWASCRRYGERVDSPAMKALAMELFDRKKETPVISRDIVLNLAAIFWGPGPAISRKSTANTISWYEHTQLLFVKNEGLTLAAKGGHNQENHNHIDVGQFIIFYQNKPVIVDLGCSEYTKETFSEKRYENWLINADAHNMPQFNGMKQQPGLEYRAGNVKFTRTSKTCVLEMDLAPAYPAETGLKKCIRTIVFNLSEQSVMIRDAWELKGDGNTVTLALHTPAEVSSRSEVWEVGNMNVQIVSNGAEVSCRKILLNDAFQRKAWGRSINRLTIAAHSGAKGEYELKFTPRKRNR